MKSHSTRKKAKCRNCGHSHELAASLQTDKMPEPGDISICIQCGTIGNFNEDFTVNPLTSTELLELHNTQPETYAFVMRTSALIKREWPKQN